MNRTFINTQMLLADLAATKMRLIVWHLNNPESAAVRHILRETYGWTI